MFNLSLNITSIMNNIVNIILALVVLMVMITIHELGHYTAGKLLKFKINEFAIGMGPKLLSKTNKNGEVVSLRVLPLGGFCAFEGEDEENPSVNAFNNKKPWQRLIVLFSGAFFNFVSAILVGVVAFSCFGDTVATVHQVYDYAPNTNITQLQEGDVIYSVDGKKVYLAGDLTSYFARTDEQLNVVVIRDGNKVTLNNIIKDNYTLTNIYNVVGDYYVDSANVNSYKITKGDTIYSINGEYLKSAGQLSTILAVSDANVDMEILTASGEIIKFKDFDKSIITTCITISESSYNGLGISVGYAKMKYSFIESLSRVIPYCFEVAVLVLRTLGGLLVGLVGIEAVGGPITTIGLTSQVVASGFGNVLSLIVMMSVNLAVFNLLPIPALDGCRMIFVAIEWIKGKPINRKVEGYINAIGLLVLLALMILLEVARYL